MSQIPKILAPGDSIEFEDIPPTTSLNYDELTDKLSARGLAAQNVNASTSSNLNLNRASNLDCADGKLNSTNDCGTNSSNVQKTLAPAVNSLNSAALSSSSGLFSNQPSLSAEIENASASDFKLRLPSISESKNNSALAETSGSAPFALETGEFGDTNFYLAPIMDSKIRRIWAEAIDFNEICNIDDQTEFRSLRLQLGIEKISTDTMTRYHVRGHMDSFDQPAICYPRFRGPGASARTIIGLKVIRRVGDKLRKEDLPDFSSEKKSKFSGIFGAHLVTTTETRVVLTTNERDALAVHDATGGAVIALSLPAGERLDASILPYLENLELIYLWFPHIHEPHAKEYASYLNASRCYIITKSERPVELVRYNRPKEILHGIQEAVRVRYRGFRSLIDIREDVKSELIENKIRTSGIAQWKRYDVLNHYLKGFRPCELTVLTGGTGIGKTTFLCEYSMDLYTQGVRTLFCSFEISEEKILKWMIIQFAGPTHVRNLARSRSYHNGIKVPLHRVDHHASVEMWLDRFERTRGNLIIMKVDEFRGKSIKEIAEAIREQVIASGIQHVVIDNLQFLVGLATFGDDTIDVQERLNITDRFVGFLRRLANDYELHVTLVVHPRRNNELEQQLELHNIGGSSRIVQEADNVFVIQRRRDEIDRLRFRKFLYILKNRFGGRRAENDQIEMVFQPSTYTHTLIEVNIK